MSLVVRDGKAGKHLRMLVLELVLLDVLCVVLIKRTLQHFVHFLDIFRIHGTG